MNRLLVFAALSIACLTTQAQSVWYELQPNDSIVGAAAFSNLNVYDFFQLNNQADTITLKWSFLSKDIPVGWEYSICDNNACYPGIPDNGTMNPIATGESGLMGFSVLPDTIVGQAIVRMYVYESQHPDEGDTLTWIVSTADIYSGVPSTTVKNKVNVFPTIANHSIRISSPVRINNLELINPLGQTMYRTVVTSYYALDISNFEPDYYWLKLYLESGETETHQVLISR